jgi:cell division protein FtsB
MADGSIRIETKLDNSALKQQIKELEKELKNIQKEKAKTDAQADSVRAK